VVVVCIRRHLRSSRTRNLGLETQTHLEPPCSSRCWWSCVVVVTFVVYVQESNCKNSLVKQKKELTCNSRRRRVSSPPVYPGVGMGGGLFVVAFAVQVHGIWDSRRICVSRTLFVKVLVLVAMCSLSMSSSQFTCM